MKLPLWEPSPEQKRNANITRFISLVNERHATKIGSFNELHDWSISHLKEFWALVWEFCGIKALKPYDTALAWDKQIMDARWFPGLVSILPRTCFATVTTELPSSSRARVRRR